MSLTPQPVEWPADHPCTDCRHMKTEHQEPLVEDGRCTTLGCFCLGWDPLTDEQWRAAFGHDRPRGGKA